MATLTVNATHDYSGDSLADVTDIVFDTAADNTQATFAAAQFDNVQISQSVVVTGDDDKLCRFIVENISGTFSVTAWTFSVLAPSFIFLQLAGSGGADTITGSSDVINALLGGDGADTLIGGDAGNIFGYFSPTDIQAGETITGGAGLDRLQISCDGAFGGNYDFSAATMSGIDEVILVGSLGAAVTTVTLNGDQIGPGGITNFDYNVSVNVRLVVFGSEVDLSGVTSAPPARIKGTAGIDSLTGSAADNSITGGRAKDTLTGGPGADTFDFNLSADSKRGAHHRDVITDFKHGQLDKIDLSDIDAKRGHGNQAFKFIGKHDFHDKKGELHYVKKAGFVLVEGDIDGDGKADFQIEVDNLHQLVGADFFL